MSKFYVTVPAHEISEMEFIHQSALTAVEAIENVLRRAKLLHSIRVICQSNAHNIQIIIGGKKALCVEACIEAEDGKYRLSVRAPDSMKVAESKSGAIFHPINRQDMPDAAGWLADRVKEILD